NWDVSSLSSTSGSIVQWNWYEDPYGNYLPQSGNFFMFYSFQGGREEEPGGLITFGARDYDRSGPAGHWVEAEPLGWAYFDGPNLYQFEHGNPVAYVDPNGFAPDPDWSIDLNPSTINKQLFDLQKAINGNSGRDIVPNKELLRRLYQAKLD